MFANSSWAKNITVRDTECTTHYEIMTLSFRVHFLPCEFGQITTLVYVPGPDYILVAERTATSYNKALRHSADDPVFLLGDFNRCDVSPLLPNVEQYMTCQTRLDKTLDLCSANVDSVYMSQNCPPLGRSDHNVIYLLPRYYQSLKRAKLTVLHCQAWTHSSVDTVS